MQIDRKFMEDRFLTLSREHKLASEVFRHVDPLNFYDNFLREGIRPDGRKLCSYRKFKVKDLFTPELFDSNCSKHCNPSHRTLQSTISSNTKLETEGSQAPPGDDDLPDQVLNDALNKNVLVSSVYLSSGNSKYHCKITADLVTVETTNCGHDPSSLAGTNDANPLSTPNKPDYCVYDLFDGSAKKTFEVDVTVPKHVVSEIYDLNGPCINISHLVSDFLENVLNSPELIPQEQFHLSSSLVATEKTYGNKGRQASWKFRVEIVCDEYDGNLMDMCFLSCAHALLNAKLPFVVYQKKCFALLNLKSNPNFGIASDRTLPAGNESYVKSYGQGPEAVAQLLQGLATNRFRRMSLKYLPLTVTFCKCSNYLLLDPTREDEQIGLNFTVYAPLRNDAFGAGADMSLDGDERMVLKQPVTVSGLRVSDDELERMYRVADELVPQLLQQ